jgi:3-phenylpropionate/trans-cinnamate dioxygenase ferredoxin reductase subunit
MTTATDRTLLIVGAGLAGAKAAEGARAAGFDGRVVLVGDEHELPYERPPLSKAVLRGEEPPETARVHDDGFYRTNAIDLLTGRTVEALDLDARRARLDGDENVPFTAAILATGAEPRRLDIPGADLGGVHYLREVADAVRLRDAILGAGRVAVIGAGWIGSEVAASARQMGAEVVLIDPGPAPLHRALGDEMGEVFRRLHADNGVKLRLRSQVTAMRGKDSVDHVVLRDGGIEPADVVVVGIGVTPRVGLAAAAGVKVDDGVVVDEHLRSSARALYAAGDVASARHPVYGVHLRVEHWANALNQGLTAGVNAVGGGETYARLPYFFSDQYDLGMEYVGHHDPGDAIVVRGDVADREFVAFWHRDGIVTAAMNVNVWDVVDDLKAIVAARRAVDPARLADPAAALGELAS